jgi:hypothetical protein
MPIAPAIFGRYPPSVVCSDVMKLEASISSSHENVVLRLNIDELPAYFEKRAAPTEQLTREK